MYDWADDFYIQARLSFPFLSGFISACQENGEEQKLMDMLVSLEKDGQATN